MNKKFKNTVLSGLQTLLVLNLNGRPPNDSIEVVAEVWCDALHSAGIWNDDRYINSLVTAFKHTAEQAAEWPAPIVVRRNMPAIINYFEALPFVQSDEDKEIVQNGISECLENLKT